MWKTILKKAAKDETITDKIIDSYIHKAVILDTDGYLLHFNDEHDNLDSNSNNNSNVTDNRLLERNRNLRMYHEFSLNFLVFLLILKFPFF